MYALGIISFLLLLSDIFIVIFIVYIRRIERRDKEFDRRLDAIIVETSDVMSDVMMMADKGEITGYDARARLESLRRQIQWIDIMMKVCRGEITISDALQRLDALCPAND